MSLFEVDSIVEIGSWDVEVTHVLFADDHAQAYQAETPDGNCVLIWVDGFALEEGAAEVLRASHPSLPRLLHTQEQDDHLVCLLEGPSRNARPFDDEDWRDVTRSTAVSALRSLVGALEKLHGVRGWLHGLKKRELLFDPDDGRLYIASMPRLHRETRPSTEAPWRDMRIVGELAYENFLGDDYPGGHQMAAILQDRNAIGELEIVFPGLPQLLAGCVSPYGDLAYDNAADLDAGLDQLQLELQRPWSFEIGAASTVGNYIFRKNNQDSCGHIAVQSICGSDKVSLGFFCVADGIGGIEDGERASRLAVEAACEAFGRGWANYGAQRLIDYPNEFAVGVAKVVGQRLALEGEFQPDNNRGGTTFSGLLIAGNRAAVCHVGDSRVALVRDGEATLLTHDHTLANILISLGEMSNSEAEAHELSQRTISRFLSTSAEVEYDRIDRFGPAARARFGAAIAADGLEVKRGDLFVLTSDGAHGELTPAEFDVLLDAWSDQPQELCDRVVENALQQIGRDNSTILAVRVY